MARWNDILSSVRTAVGATTEPDAKAWIVSAARRLNARAEFLTANVTIGPTVAGEDEYTISSYVDLTSIRVDGYSYTRATPDEIDNLATSEAYIVSGPGRLYAPSWSSIGTPSIKLWPVPDESGQMITGRAVLDIEGVDDWLTDDPPFPSDFDDAITHGAIAKGLALQDEQLDAAQWHEDRFLGAVNELKRRRHSRVGSGPVRIRVAGRDA